MSFFVQDINEFCVLVSLLDVVINSYWYTVTKDVFKLDIRNMEVEMAEQIWQEPTESENTGPWLADYQSCDLNNEFRLVVYLYRSVPVIYHFSVARRFGWLTVLSSMKIVEQELDFFNMPE